MNASNFYLEFDIASPVRFDSLLRMFLALKKEKALFLEATDGDSPEQEYQPENDPQWREFLDEQAIEWFADSFDYQSEEGKIYLRLWELTDPDARFDNPLLTAPGNWDFDSMIDSLFRGEYEFDDLVEESPGQGVLYYNPLACPFGGTESMVALIESFGHTVTFDSFHEGPHRRSTVGWDYALAKKLVAAGKGVPGKSTQ